ncbi:MAG: hypothetical protein JO001_00695 [Alphaproteobacteria bacterium]|nr:hypothetical protein [Alphaproteobacteria bacterium]
MLAQEDADFAIPFFDEDIPLYVDPFLMWRSPSMQDNSLHEMLMAAFNHVGKLAQGGGRDAAIDMLVTASNEKYCPRDGIAHTAEEFTQADHDGLVRLPFDVRRAADRHLIMDSPRSRYESHRLTGATTV